MPIQAHKLGPGELTLGVGALEVNMQLLACKVTPSETVNTTDRRKVLSGEVLEGTSTAEYTYVLEGTFLQDLVDGGVVAWSWDNKGEPQAFTFVPNSAVARQVSGELVPVPLQIGGDEVDGPEMEAAFTWRIEGEPAFGDAV